jgi:hypothetical protein
MNGVCSAITYAPPPPFVPGPSLRQGTCQGRTDSPLFPHYKALATGGNAAFFSGFCSAYQAMSLIGYTAPTSYDSDAARFQALLQPGGGALPPAGAGSPPAAGARVVTGLSVVTGAASCRSTSQTVPLRPASGAAKALTLCARTAVVPSAPVPFSFVSNVVVASVPGSGERTPPLNAVTCPPGHRKIRKNLRAGLPAINGTAVSAVLCFKTSRNAAAEAPVVSLSAVASADACDDQLVGSAAAGDAVNTADGTGAPASYICIKR